MYPTFNEGKSVVAERFIRTLNIYFHVLDDLVNKYNNTVHRTIKMKPICVISDSYVEYIENSNVTKSKFKFGDHVRISKYKNIFAKGYTQNWLEQVFLVSKLKDTVLWTCEISDLNGEKTAGSFYEKELQKTNHNKYRIEKIIKKKGDRSQLNGKDTIIHLIVGLIIKVLNEIPSYKNESILS